MLADNNSLTEAQKEVLRILTQEYLKQNLTNPITFHEERHLNAIVQLTKIGAIAGVMVASVPMPPSTCILKYKGYYTLSALGVTMAMELWSKSAGGDGSLTFPEDIL